MNFQDLDRKSPMDDKSQNSQKDGLELSKKPSNQSRSILSWIFGESGGSREAEEEKLPISESTITTGPKNSLYGDQASSGLSSRGDTPFNELGEFLPRQGGLDNSLAYAISLKNLSTHISYGTVSQNLDINSFFRKESLQVPSEDSYIGGAEYRCELGEGSEGKLHLVRLIDDYDDLPDLLALKAFKNHSENSLVKAIKEFYLVKSLKNSNIIKYYKLLFPNSYNDHKEAANFGILMEYMPGGSLDEHIERCYHKIQISDKKKLLKQLLLGLDYLHKKNIIHRDIKVATSLIELIC